MKEGINVLSLFDGCGTGMAALNEANISVKNYFASEIDASAMVISNKNFPEIKQIGDVKKIDTNDLPKIDLLLGGSPCQSFSSVGNSTGFDGKSGLFYEFVRIFKETNPKHFLFENVHMKKEWRDIISRELCVEPIAFNSNLVSAQNRDRLYWTNINFDLPCDKGIEFKDVLDDLPYRDLRPFMFKKWGNKTRINKGVNWILNKKSNCLTTKNCHPLQYLLNEDRDKMRLLTVREYERLQTLPENFTAGVNNTQRFKMIGNGWTLAVISHILKHLSQ